ncbi:hypothetical protein Q2T42_14250 [Leptolyngbya boryana CZ1]|uniref:Uncharacterized protein n=1 Tax=Leptolyngbya boryana CZ1 TaxID=3060204 RepID=A0AA97ARW5_LEPBY|nr:MULTISPECIES: hypothetical protein [Leptolyngbya]MBD1858172.1 hypothetical protein [Leptolyngbya sp. FACHB-1624]WNZ48983.1 hypothetical protein Q2T42_14250 [Leptolyngbya boryana CZ1]
MANPNPGDPQDRTNYPGSTSNDPLNPPSYNRNDLSRQTVERQRYADAQQARDENNTANGFLIGILLTGLVLGGAALAYFVTQRDRTPVPQRTIVVPSASPSPSPSPEVRERVIERDRIVPVPQPQQSAPVVVPAPEVRIESPRPNPQTSPSTPSSQQQEPARQEQPRSTSEPTTTPSPEATASPSPSNTGQ